MFRKSNSTIPVIGNQLPSVLLIEDELHGELVSAILQESGISVWHATDADDAVKAIHSFRPDVMLVASNENGPDGHTIVTQLKASAPSLKSVPVIMMTEERMTQVARRSLASLNVTWILEKPLVLTSLPKLIRATIRGSGNDMIQSERFVRQLAFGQSASSALMKCVV